MTPAPLFLLVDLPDGASETEQLALRDWIASATAEGGAFAACAHRIEGASHLLALPSAAPAFDLHAACNLALWPCPVRTILASASPERANKARAHRRRRRWPFLLELDGFAAPVAALAESAARLHAAILADWKPSRAKAAATMRTVTTQQDAADALGIRQQSVSDALRAAHAKDLVALEDSVREVLRALDLTLI